MNTDRPKNIVNQKYKVKYPYLGKVSLSTVKKPEIYESNQQPTSSTSSLDCVSGLIDALLARDPPALITALLPVETIHSFIAMHSFANRKHSLTVFRFFHISFIIYSPNHAPSLIYD